MRWCPAKRYFKEDFWMYLTCKVCESGAFSVWLSAALTGFLLMDVREGRNAQDLVAVSQTSAPHVLPSRESMQMGFIIPLID